MILQLVSIFVTMTVLFSSTLYAVDFGERVGPEDFQDVVGIALFDDQNQEARLFCTGVLVHPRIVLTAAHCLQEGGRRQSSTQLRQLTTKLRLVMGEGAKDGVVTQKLLPIKRSVLHPRYLRDIRGQADVAILELFEDAPIDPALIRPLALDLMQLRERIRRQAKLTIVGYGFSEQIENRFRTIETFGLKHKGEIEIIGKTADEIFVIPGPPIDRFGLYRQAPREGDSGGPAFFKDSDGQYYLAGLVSRATQFNHGPRGTAYSLLRNWVCWIEQETQISLRDQLHQEINFCDIKAPQTRVQHLNGVSFLDQCQQNQDIPASALYTIEVLKTIFNKPNCRELERELQRQTNLNLDSTYISDLSPLQDFTQLERLSVRDNAITSITPLINHQQLRTLDISYNFVRDADEIKSKLPESLWLIGISRQYNTINQTEFIRLCQNPDIDPQKRRTIDALMRLFAAEKDECVNANYELIRRRGLEFYQSQGLIDMSALAGLNTLEELDLRGQQVSDLSFLNQMSELRVLILDGNPVKDLTPLLSHPNLRVLSVQNMNLTDLDIIAKLPRLRELSVHGNQIQDFGLFEERERRNIIRLLGKDEQR